MQQRLRSENRAIVRVQKEVRRCRLSPKRRVVVVVEGGMKSMEMVRWRFAKLAQEQQASLDVLSFN
jgi:hypothetical protein